MAVWLASGRRAVSCRAAQRWAPRSSWAAGLPVLVRSICSAPVACAMPLLASCLCLLPASACFLPLLASCLCLLPAPACFLPLLASCLWLLPASVCFLRPATQLAVFQRLPAMMSLTFSLPCPPYDVVPSAARDLLYRADPPHSAVMPGKPKDEKQVPRCARDDTGRKRQAVRRKTVR